MTKEKIVISKEEVRKLRAKGRAKSRRLETIHLKPKIHQDKRTKRKRTRKAKKDSILNDSE